MTKKVLWPTKRLTVVIRWVKSYIYSSQRNLITFYTGSQARKGRKEMKDYPCTWLSTSIVMKLFYDCESDRLYLSTSHHAHCVPVRPTKWNITTCLKEIEKFTLKFNWIFFRKVTDRLVNGLSIIDTTILRRKSRFDKAGRCYQNHKSKQIPSAHQS